MINELLLVVLIILALPYIIPAMPDDVQRLFNNTIRTFDNTLRVLDIGSAAVLSVTADVSGGAAFAGEGKNPLAFI